MSMLQTIVNAFAPGGNQGVQQRKQQMQIQKQDAEERKAEALQRQSEHDIALHQTLLEQGYKPVVNNMVQEDYSDLPMFSAPAPPGSAIPQDAQMPSSVPAIPAQTLLRPVDKSRLHTMTDHTGETVSYERPASLLDQMRAKARANAPMLEAASKQAGNLAEQGVLGRERGLQAVRNSPSGIALPPGSGVAEGQKYSPEELPGVVQGVTAATELPGKILQSQRYEIAQSLGSVTEPAAYKALYDLYSRKYPDAMTGIDTPDKFDVTKSPMKARMAGMSLPDQQKASLLLNMSPQDYHAQVDSVLPPVGPYAALNKSLHMQVDSSLRNGDREEAQKLIKGAFDKQQTNTGAVETAKNTAGTKVYVARESALARSDAAGLTDDDYARAGQEYGMTGVMPPLGRDNVTRSRIMKASNDWARDNGYSPRDIVQIQAAFSGDKKSLANFQKQRDQISSFEQTAGKNLDLFLDAASKIPDTGSPWLNKPLRTLDANAVGSENMAAVNAARQVANNEIAKVTSGGGLTGVLSDSARHEVEAYNPNNATFKQTIAVAKILKQDMANRMQSMDATLGEIKSRMGGPPGGGNANAVPDAVKTLLGAANVGPGVHKLSDGSSWMKAADGTITKQ